MSAVASRIATARRFALCNRPIQLCHGPLAQNGVPWQALVSQAAAGQRFASSKSARKHALKQKRAEEMAERKRLKKLAKRKRAEERGETKQCKAKDSRAQRSQAASQATQSQNASAAQSQTAASASGSAPGWWMADGGSQPSLLHGKPLPSTPVESYAQVSKIRFEQAVKDREACRGTWLCPTPVAKLLHRFKKWWHPSPLDPELDKIASLSEAHMTVARSNSPWAFSLRPLPLPGPEDASWPPRLPTYRDLPADMTLGHPSLVGTKAGSTYTNRTPRDVAALALDLSAFIGRPTIDGVRSQQRCAEVNSPPNAKINVWRFTKRLNAASTDDEDLAWVRETNGRLEIVGDSLQYEMVLKALFWRCPDMGASGLGQASSHLTMNDTLSQLFEISGLQQFRKELAEEILREAVAREIENTRTLKAPGRQREENLQIDEIESPSLYVEGNVRADMFEAYIAYLKLVHGNEVAEKWFLTLLEPWIQRVLDQHKFVETTRSAAGIFRRSIAGW